MRADYTTTVLGQPRALEQSANHVRSQLDALDSAPWSSGVLGIVGMGASAHAAHLLAHVLTSNGRRAVALTASQFLADDFCPPADCYLLVSESGESVETVRAAAQLRGMPRLALTNTSASPLREQVEAHVELGCGSDSAVYTIGYTATLQAFALIAGWLGVGGSDVCVADVAAASTEVLQSSAATLGSLVDRFASARAVDVVGHGAHYCTAAETALMVREAARIPATCHDTYEYLHGPMEWLDRDSACLLFGSGRELRLAKFVAGTGATTLLVTSGTNTAPSGVHVVQLPRAGAVTTSVLEALPMQLLLRDVAACRGLAIDGFRYHQDDTKISGHY